MKNKQRKEIKIAKETSWVFLYANLWFLGIIYLIYLGIFYGLLPFLESSAIVTPDFFNFTHGAAKWYMLIYGAIGANYYFPMYVQLGVTRKKTFIGTILGVFAGAISLVILALFISEVHQLVVGLLGLEVAWDTPLFHTFVGNGFPENNTFLAAVGRLGITMLSYMVSVVLVYAIGWMSGTAYYRGNIWKGMGAILLGFLTILLADLMWGDGFLAFLPRLTLGPNALAQWLFAMLGTVVLIGLLLWLIRALTKQITIKLN